MRGQFTKIFPTLPRLAIVRISDLLLYEKFDPIRTQRLISKIPRDRMFINPIVVACIPNFSKKIVLDGVNRVEALKSLNIPYVLTQVVDYYDHSQVALFNNIHYLDGIDREIILKYLDNNLLGLVRVNELIALDKCNQGSMAGYLKFGDIKNVFSLGSHHNLHTSVTLLNSLVDSYAGKCQIRRLSEFAFKGSKFRVEVGFRRFKPQEIVQIAQKGWHLNSGITRHVLSAYAIRLNIPLNLLKNSGNLTIKNQALQKYLLNKLNKKEIRYYSSPTYLFDEWKKEK